MSRVPPRIVDAARIGDILATGSLHHVTPSRIGRTRVLSVCTVAQTFVGYDFAGHVLDTPASRLVFGVAS